MAEHCNERPPTVGIPSSSAAARRWASAAQGRQHAVSVRQRPQVQALLPRRGRAARTRRTRRERVGKAISEWSARHTPTSSLERSTSFIQRVTGTGDASSPSSSPGSTPSDAVDGGRTAVERYARTPRPRPPRARGRRSHRRRPARALSGSRLRARTLHRAHEPHHRSPCLGNEPDRLTRGRPMGRAPLPGDVRASRPRRCGDRSSTYLPDEEAELLAELERLADEHGLSRDPGGLTEAFRVGSRQLLRFVPPSRSAEPSLFTAEGDPVVHARADVDDRRPRGCPHASTRRPSSCGWARARTAAASASSSPPTGPRCSRRDRRCRRGGLFFESSYEGYPDRVGLGTFVLAGDELTFDAISEARLERAIQLIARPPRRATHDATRDRALGTSTRSSRSAAGRGRRVHCRVPRRIPPPVARRAAAMPRGASLHAQQRTRRTCAPRSSASYAPSRTEPHTPDATVTHGPTSAGCGTSSASTRNSPRSARRAPRSGMTDDG